MVGRECVKWNANALKALKVLQLSSGTWESNSEQYRSRLKEEVDYSFSPRVINVKFLLQPYQEYYITQGKELAFA